MTTTATPTKSLTFHRTTTGRYWAENRERTRRYVVAQDFAGKWLVMKFSLTIRHGITLTTGDAEWTEVEDRLRYGKALAEVMEARYTGRTADADAWNEYRSI